MYVTIPNDDIRPIAIETFAQSKRTRQLPAGTYLYYEADTVTQLFQIETGVVRLTRVLEDGRRQVIAFGYPGDIVGFPAQGLHHTDCDALTETVLTPISRKVLDDSDQDPELHGQLVAAALREISAMQDHFMMLGRRSAPEKVACFLRVLLERIADKGREPPVIDLPMTRGDIADFLGLTTETVSRCLSALRKSGVVTMRGVNRIAVLDQAALCLRAEGTLH
jgi:CRP/FNR family transcriptional regulator